MQCRQVPRLRSPLLLLCLAARRWSLSQLATFLGQQAFLLPFLRPLTQHETTSLICALFLLAHSPPSHLRASDRIDEEKALSVPHLCLRCPRSGPESDQAATNTHAPHLTACAIITLLTSSGVSSLALRSSCSTGLGWTDRDWTSTDLVTALADGFSRISSRGSRAAAPLSISPSVLVATYLGSSRRRWTGSDPAYHLSTACCCWAPSHKHL